MTAAELKGAGPVPELEDGENLQTLELALARAADLRLDLVSIYL